MLLLAFQGVRDSLFVSLSSSISADVINRYSAIGSPCLHPLPTLIRVDKLPLGIVMSEKFWRRVFIQAMVVLLNFMSFSVHLM